jgi:ArsR family transcriptional regulator
MLNRPPSGLDISTTLDMLPTMRQPTVDLTRTVERLRALSDPTRLEILALLKPGEQCVCELTSALDAAQSRLSFHLKVLKEAGLVTDRRDGRWVYYTLVDDAVEEVATFLTSAPSAGWRKAARCCS